MTTSLWSRKLLPFRRNLVHDRFFSRICFAKSFVFNVVFCRSCFRPFFAILLAALLRFTISDYSNSLGNFKLFFK